MTTSGEGSRRGPVAAPRPSGLRPVADGPRWALLVEVLVVSRRTTLWVYGVLAAWLLTTSLAMAVVALLTSPALLVVTVVGGVVGLLALRGFVVTRRRAADEVHGLVLTPEGIAVRLPLGAGWLRWEDVRAVRQRWTETPGSGAGPIRIDWVVLDVPGWDGAVRADVPGPALPLDVLAADPHAVVALLHHYRHHPGDRAELADGRALARFASGSGGGEERGGPRAPRMGP